MVIAVPLGVAVALFLTQYAPAWLRGPAAATIDLLAAVPSIVYGFWGLTIAGQYFTPIQEGDLEGLRLDPGLRGRRFQRQEHPGLRRAHPRHHGPADHHGDLPRGVRAGAHGPQGGRAGAGRHPVGDDPHRRAAVRQARHHQRLDARPGPRPRRDPRRGHPPLRASTPRPAWNWSVFNGGSTFASKIAGGASEFDSPQKTGAYIAAGLVLFVLTFAVNAVARIVIERRKAFTE